MNSEYTEMRKRKLFSDREIKEIQRKRNYFQHKLAAPKKTDEERKIVFCEYISYERRLLDIVCRKEKKPFCENCATFEFHFMARIKDLYKDAINLFPSESRFWDNYIKYAMKCNFTSEVSITLQKMLQFHGNLPNLWLDAAMWEYKETHNMEKVKDIFFRGLQMHPQEEQLYIEFIKVMLLELSEKHTNSQNEQDFSLEEILKIYEFSRSKINDIKYISSLLEITEKCSFAKDFQTLILQDMIRSFPKDEPMFDIMAQCELRGLETYELLKRDYKFIQSENPEGSDSSVRTRTSIYDNVKMKTSSTCSEKQNNTNNNNLSNRIQSCVEIYKFAVNELKTNEMWSLYIDAMLELSFDETEEKDLKYSCLMKSFEQACNANHLPEKYFISYIEFLRESEISEDHLLEVLKKSTKVYPESIELWKLQMSYYVAKNKVKRVDEIFNEALEIFKAKQLESRTSELWRIRLECHRMNFNDKVEKIFLEAVRHSFPEFLSFRVEYLEYTANCRTIEETRKLYESLIQFNPPYLELHQRMILLETSLFKPNAIEIRKDHEHIIKFFGKENPEIWLDYIKFERDYGNAENAFILFKKARDTLDSTLIDHFTLRYRLLPGVRKPSEENLKETQGNKSQPY